MVFGEEGWGSHLGCAGKGYSHKGKQKYLLGNLSLQFYFSARLKKGWSDRRARWQQAKEAGILKHNLSDKIDEHGSQIINEGKR